MYNKLWLLCLYHPHTPPEMVYLRNITKAELDRFNKDGHPLGEFTVSAKTYDRNFEEVHDPNLFALFVTRSALRQRKFEVQVVHRRPGEPNLIFEWLMWISYFLIAVFALIGIGTVLYLLAEHIF